MGLLSRLFLVLNLSSSKWFPLLYLKFWYNYLFLYAIFFWAFIIDNKSLNGYLGAASETQKNFTYSYLNSIFLEGKKTPSSFQWPLSPETRQCSWPYLCTLRVYWLSSPVCCLQNWSLYLSGRHLLILSCANWIPSCFENALPRSWKVQVAFTQKTFWEQLMVFTVGTIIEGIIFYSGASKQKGLLSLKCVVFWNARLTWRRATGFPYSYPSLSTWHQQSLSYLGKN